MLPQNHCQRAGDHRQIPGEVLALGVSGTAFTLTHDVSDAIRVVADFLSKASAVSLRWPAEREDLGPFADDLTRLVRSLRTTPRGMKGFAGGGKGAGYNVAHMVRTWLYAFERHCLPAEGLRGVGAAAFFAHLSLKRALEWLPDEGAYLKARCLAGCTYEACSKRFGCSPLLVSSLFCFTGKKRLSDAAVQKLLTADYADLLAPVLRWEFLLESGTELPREDTFSPTPASIAATLTICPTSTVLPESPLSATPPPWKRSTCRPPCAACPRTAALPTSPV